MKIVIERYKKLIFVYVLFNCFALVVNLFNVDANSKSYGEFAYNPFRRVSRTTTYFLTNNLEGNKNSLWPFVSYTSTVYDDPLITIDKRFNGIFYQYDFGEFLVYIGLLFVFLIYKAYIATPPLKTKTSIINHD